jgi:creatinine amidohydrolase
MSAAPTAGRGLRWEDLRSDEVGAMVADPDAWFVLLPIGAVEQHGDHLPVDVDIHCAQGVCDGVAARDGHVLVAPPIPWGFSPGQTFRPGTITLRGETLLALLRDVLGSIYATGFRHVMVVNGHNGNKWMAGQAVSEIARPAGATLSALTYFDLTLDVFREHRVSGVGGEGHGGELETALELFLRPEGVQDERAVRYVESITDHGMRDLAVRGALLGIAGPEPMSATYPDGIMGDPTVATAELGARLFGAAVTGIEEIIADVRRSVGAPTEKHGA